MHELSIIHSIIEATEAELRKQQGPCSVEQIELEIGSLAGIEVDTLEFLWPAAVEHTLLEKAECRILRTAGEAQCDTCKRSFPIQHFSDPCPGCGSHFIQIRKGEELRIKSITLVSETPDAHLLNSISLN